MIPMPEYSIINRVILICCYAIWISLLGNQAWGYAWILAIGKINKRLSVIQEQPIHAIYQKQHYIQDMLLYTESTESKVSIGLRNNLMFQYDTTVWNMSDAITTTTAEGVDLKWLQQYAITQHRLSLVWRLYHNQWYSASARLAIQSGYYYPQFHKYIKHGEAIAIGTAYGRSWALNRWPLVHAAYIDIGAYCKLYHRLAHREWRVDWKVGAKLIPQMEIALGIYRIWGLTAVPRGSTAAYLSNFYLRTLGIAPQKDMHSHEQMYVARHTVDRLYMKASYDLGARQIELDAVIGGEATKHGRLRLTKNPTSGRTSATRLWKRVSLILSYSITL